MHSPFASYSKLRGPLARRRTDVLSPNHRLPSIYRILGDENSKSVATGPFARDAKLALVEAALLAADEPLTARRIATVTDLEDAALVRRLLSKLQTFYEEEGSAFQVHEIAGGFQLLTPPEYHPWLLRLRHRGHDLRLSPSSRETRAIRAYHLPIIRTCRPAYRPVHFGDFLR